MANSVDSQSPSDEEIPIQAQKVIRIAKAVREEFDPDQFGLVFSMAVQATFNQDIFNINPIGPRPV